MTEHRAMKLFFLLLSAARVWAGDVSLTVAGLRIMPERWNKAANLAKFEHYARDAAAKGANLALAPEGFLEGYVGNTSANPKTTEEKYRAAGEPIDGPSLRRVRDLARELKIHLGIGFAESRGGRMYNSFAIFGPAGELVLHYSKAHNADDEPFNTTGREFPVSSTALGRWGALICYDRQLPETSRILAIKGAQLILVPAWGGHGEMNDAMMRTRAFENSVWVAFVHPQRTLIIDPRGTIVAQDDGGGDQIVMARITFDSRIGKGAIHSRKPELYRELVK
jgi:predicted amidohydrolase